jgi:hypothetical protein
MRWTNSVKSVLPYPGFTTFLQGAGADKDKDKDTVVDRTRSLVMMMMMKLL